MSDLRNHANIEMIKPGDLKVAPTHARKHSPKQIEQIARVIDRIGFIVPIIIDDDNVIAAGVGRREAAMLRNLELVPVIRVQFVSEADRRAFALADNRLVELSEWDDDLLKDELEFLFEADYDLDITGFGLGDLDLGVPTDDPEPPIELPDRDAVAVSRTGDKWLIGPHMLLCSNSRDAVSYEALLGEERAAMVFSDPPYNVKIDGHVSGLGQTRHREFAEACGEMTPAEFTNFHRSVFRLCTRFSVDGSIHYHCMDWRHIREILDAADGIYTEFKQLVVWAKNNAGMGTFYRSRHELIFVFKSGNAKHTNNFGLGDKGRYRTNVWEVEGANTFRKGRAQDLADHPTVKPVTLVADAILDCSNRGDLILDPFSGSGTTLLAAHRTHRRGAAIEIDPLHVDTSLRRLAAATGFAPTHADGRTFEEVAANRASEEKIDG
jgi:DNA modification methylase